MAYTHATSINKFGVTPLVVATSAANGSHTTLASAMADAVSGDTIFLRDSVTENVTLTAGVNIAAWTGGTINTPTITGTLTMTTAGTCNISGIRLVTNSAALLAVTGSSASIVNLYNCYLNCSNNTGITLSSSSGSAKIVLSFCGGDIGTTGIAIFAHSSAGSLIFNFSAITNSGSSVTSSTCSSGVISFLSSSIASPITTSSTGVILSLYTTFNTITQSTTPLTCGGAASSMILSQLSGGTASALSVGGTLGLSNCDISSINTNAITGAGTLNYSGLTFSSTSSKINTTTQIGGTLIGGQTQAPSSGYLGQSISNTATSVATTSTVAKTITSIALTPGVWDISAFAGATPTGGTLIILIMQVGISDTDNTITGNLGIEYYQENIVGGATTMSGSVPSYRVTLTSNTTYYLVVGNVYTSTTCPTNGRISATRVG